MRIGIDVSFLFDQYSHRGIGYYGREVISRLIQEEDVEWILFGFKDLKQNLAELKVKKSKNIRFVSLGRPRNSNPFNPIFYSLFYKRKVKREKLDLFFSPHFERLVPIGITKTVVMMHDVIPYITGSFSQKSKFTNFIKGIFYRHNLKKSKKADLILTNSDFTKRELINKASFEKNKVERVHLGISDRFRNSNISPEVKDIRRVLIMYKISKPYILYYGGLEANKNVTSIIHAFQIASKRHPDLKLVIAGKEFKVGWDNKAIPQTQSARALLELITDLKLKHKVILTGEVDENHLPLILSNAATFIHLSIYEGFGLSVLEALAAGVPLITTRRSSYPELLEEAPLYVSPDNSEAIAESIQSVMQDDKKRAQIIKKGIEISNKYTWEITAEKTFNKFKSIGKTVTPTKITYVTPYFYPFKGGAEQNCLGLALQMVDLGHEVTVLTSHIPGEENEDEEVYGGITIKRHNRFNKAYYLGFYPKLLFSLLANKSDVIHVHGFGFMWQDFCLVIKKLFNRRVKIINTPHGPFMALNSYSFAKKILRSIYTLIQKLFVRRIYSAVIKVNPYQEKWIRKYGIKDSKIFYIPNGIPEDYFELPDTNKVDKKYNLTKKKVISFIGRYEKYKGVQDVLSAVDKLKTKHKSIKFMAMGREGKNLEALQQQLTELKLESHAMLLESPDDNTKESILTSSEINILPSQWEAFGISILEAMAKGNAIISTRTEGGEFLIEEGKNGFLYDYGDERELENLINKLLTNNTLRKSIQEKNIEKAKQFSWNKIAIDYYELIKNLLK